MKKLLFILLIAFLQFASFGQIIPTTVSGGVVTISGKGKIGGTKDGAQWRRYKFARSGNFMLAAYFRSLTNSNNSFTGIAFRDETTGLKTDGGLPAVALFYENDTLKAKTKLTQDSKFVDVAVLPNVKSPGWLKIEKNNNTIKFYYSTSAETATTPAYTQMTAVANVFSGWNTITQNFATGNRLGTSSTAVVSNIQFGAVTGDGAVPCANGATFDILSVTANSGNIYDVDFNAANFSSTNVDIKNSAGVSVKNFTSAVTARPLSIDIGTQTSGTYTLTFTGQSCSGVASKTFEVAGLVVNGGGGTTGQNIFVNHTKNVPIETLTGKYSPHLFPQIGTVNSFDAVLGKTYPNWAIAWQAEGANFSTNSRKTYDVGISFMYDQIQGSYGGYGLRCTDYLSFFHPNTSDPTCLKSNGQPYQYSEFTSAIPFEKKAWATYGQANSAIWDAYSLQNAYDEGANASNAIQYGWGDKVNNKVNVGLANADIEVGYELGQDGSNKHLAFLQGMANNSQGYIFSQYSGPLNIVYIDPSNYPTTNNAISGYPAFRLNPDESLRGSNGAVPNQVPYSADWNFSNTLSLTGKSLFDYKNALPCAELSSYSDATFVQGETFVYDNSGNTRVANKFYPNPNTNHVIAAVIHSGEVNKWFVKNKLDNRKIFLQSKITCDRGAIGLNQYNEYGFNITNSSLAGKQFNREYSFDIGGFTAMTGCEWTVWDRNYAGHNLDGYNGVFGIINVLHQRKIFGANSVSFVDLKPRANFLLWQSEISYDNGATFVNDKAHHYLLQRTHIPQRQFVTTDGYWGGFLARPENTENTNCILRVNWNGQNYTYVITADMWETVDYSSRNIALSALPNDKKDYHFFIVKLSGSGGAVQ
jgi:hypothetical protein